MSNKEVIVISDKVVSTIYDGDNDKILGKVINIDTSSHGPRSYTVVGVYKYEPVSLGVLGGSGETTTAAYIPYTVGNR